MKPKMKPYTPERPSLIPEELTELINKIINEKLEELRLEIMNILSVKIIPDIEGLKIDVNILKEGENL